MSNANAVLLIPLDITAEMIATGTSVPVVDSGAGEVAWVSTDPCVVGDRRNHLGSIWEALATSTGVEPGTDATKWLRVGPSNRLSAFDHQLDTVTQAKGEIVYVLRPGFFTGLIIWGIVGDQVEVTIYDKPDGVVVEHMQADLYVQAMGLYELLFMPLAKRTQVFMQNLPLYPNAQVHIKVSSNNPDSTCEIVAVSIGHWSTFIGTGHWGGTEYDAQADVKSYSYIQRQEDGSVKRVRRGSADNLVCTVVLPADQANHAMDLLRRAQGRPVGYIANGHPQYEYLNGFGDIAGSVSPKGPSVARLSLKLEGAVQRPRS